MAGRSLSPSFRLDDVLKTLPNRRVFLPVLCGLVLFPLFISILRSNYLFSRTHVYPDPSPVPPDDDIINKTDGHKDLSYHHNDAVKAHPLNPQVASISQNTFWHSDFFRPPVRQNVPDYCGNVTTENIHQLARNVPKPVHILTPHAYHFYDGVLVDAGHHTFPAESGFCTVFLVPQAPWRRLLQFEQLPIERVGPDSIQAEMSSSDVKLVFTDHPQYWGMTTTQDGRWTKETVDFAVYASSYELNHPGDYQLEAIVEWHSYDWAMEEPIDMYKMFHRYRHDTNMTVTAQSPPVVITGKPKSRPKQRCFFDGFDDMRGRWYRAGSFGAHGHQTAMNVKARVEWADKIPTIDDWGWTFAPDACSLTFFTFSDHGKCFSHKNIQVLGDSNARRVLKSVIGGTERWCPGFNFGERIAQCEDREEKQLTDFEGQKVDLALLHDQAEDRMRPVTFGDGTKLFIDFVGGVVRSSIFNGWQLYLDGNRNPKDKTSKERLSVTVQRQVDHGPTDVVYVSLITWDVSHMITPAETLAMLPDFRTKLLESYDEKARIIIRLSQSPSWGNYNNRSRFSIPRFAMWNNLYREFFHEDWKAGRVKFEDASVLQGRRDAEQSSKCVQTHLRCSQVRLEEQIWMNTICEKLWNGNVRLRDWS